MQDKIDFATLQTKVPIPLGTGFSHATASVSTSHYVKNGNRVEIYIAAQKNSGNIALNDVIAVLPSEIRPASNSEFAQGVGAGAGNVFLGIRANGNVEVSSLTGTFNILIARAWYYL